MGGTGVKWLSAAVQLVLLDPSGIAVVSSGAWPLAAVVGTWEMQLPAGLDPCSSAMKRRERVPRESACAVILLPCVPLGREFWQEAAFVPDTSAPVTGTAVPGGTWATDGAL